MKTIILVISLSVMGMAQQENNWASNQWAIHVITLNHLLQEYKTKCEADSFICFSYGQVGDADTNIYRLSNTGEKEYWVYHYKTINEYRQTKPTFEGFIDFIKQKYDRYCK